MDIKGIIKDTIAITIVTLIAGLLLGLSYKVTKEPIKEQKELAEKRAFVAVFEKAKDFKKTYDSNVENQSEEAKAIAEKANKAMREAGYTTVLKAAVDAVDENGKKIGAVFSVSSNEGYAGEIVISVGITNEGVLNGISIISINETPGLGMNAKEPQFMNQFSNKKVEKLDYIKSKPSKDEEIECISGATITSRAITNLVNSSLVAFKALGGE